MTTLESDRLEPWIPVADGRNLPPFPPQSRAAGFLLHASALGGLLLPLLGHVGLPYLVYRCHGGVRQRVFRAHWRAIRRSQTRWGTAMALAYALCWWVGLPCILLVLAVAIPWSILLVIAASQAEDGLPVRRSGPWA